MSVFLLVVGLVLFIGLVVIHEWGHFIMARRNGVTVEEFGIFFPPRIYKHKTKAGWNFTINALPLGGFVKMKGEHDTDTAKGSYGAASLKGKTEIMAAGVVMNLIVAFVLLTILALFGMPKIIDNQFTVKSDTHVTHQASANVQISSVLSGSPAAKAGLKANDIVTAIGPAGHEQTLHASDDLQKATQRYAGQKIEIDYKRGNVAHRATTTLTSAAVVKASAKSAHPKYYLGVEFGDITSGLTVQRSTWSAPIVAGGLMGQFTVLTFQGLGHAIAGLGSIIAGVSTGNQTARAHGQTQASSQVGGPVAIFYVLKDGSALGWGFMLFIIAIVSLTLAIMNILPIPALDGGRLWLTLFTRAIKKPLTPKLEERINLTGFAVLLALVVVITFVDLHRFSGLNL